MFIVVFILLGLFVGSFINVCIDRLPRGESIVFPASRCESCNHKLAVLDLVPVFSYILLRGRCRYCQARIPLRLPIVEAVTAFLFAFFYWQFGFTLELAVFIIYASLLIIIFVTDLENQLVLNKVVYPGMVIAFAFAFFRPEVAEIDVFGAGSISQAVNSVAGDYVGRAVIALTGGVLGLVIMSLPYILYPKGMGMGDIKLAALVGLMVGYPLVIMVLMLSWIGGGLIAGVLLALKIKGRKDPLPAATFTVVAALVTLLWGQAIWEWYL
jgi:leader peptidase (prepilin peptidase)/N-methyltransferase